MANISDSIEQFIITTMADSESIEISRNSLAEYFACAPSQINYVLDTRFTLDKGFIKESKRGGSGFIKITKVQHSDSNEFLSVLIKDSVGEDLNFKRLSQILDKLSEDKIVSGRERDIIKSSLSDDSLLMPTTIRDRVRAQSFKNILEQLMLSGN
ncbi:MAG: CtsR family transcriptional regulator [Clostridia bacterium]|nr:CtsR family transcriptional regulator [Clostridia bacterium]